MPATDTRGSLEKDRKNEFQDAFPFDGVDVGDPAQVQSYLDTMNTSLADAESSLLYATLKPGMAGSNGEPYAIPSPGLDAGSFKIEKV